jgi:hypothetical protein
VLPDTVSARDLLRHCLATVAYRGGKSLRGAPDSFADFRVAEASRTPAQILAHLGDLFEWALSLSKGKQAWHDSKPLPWAQEVDRFFKTLSDFDNYLGASEPLHASPEQLFQGPIASAKSPCCADSTALPSRAKTTSRQISLRAALVRTRLPQRVNSKKTFTFISRPPR